MTKQIKLLNRPSTDRCKQSIEFKSSKRLDERRCCIVVSYRANMSSDKVQVAPVSEFELTFLPVLKWMRLIGALAPSSHINCVYLFGFAYRCAAWFFTLFVHGFCLFNALYWFLTSANNKETLVWVEIINSVSKSAHAVGIHTVMFFLLVERWDQLKYSLNRTENRLGLKRIDYYKFWHLGLAGVFYIIASVINMRILKEQSSI